MEDDTTKDKSINNLYRIQDTSYVKFLSLKRSYFGTLLAVFGNSWEQAGFEMIVFGYGCIHISL